MRSVILSLATLVIGASAASGQCTNMPKFQTCVSVSSLRITGSYADHIDIRPGASLNLGLVALDSTGVSIKNHIVKWSVADASIASITSGGKITGLKYGTTSVLLQVGLQSTRLPVLVTPYAFSSCAVVGPCASVAVLEQVPPPVLGDTTDHTDLRAGFAYTMGLVAQDSVGGLIAAHSVAWWSADTTIANVTKAGRVTGIRTGTTSLWLRVGLSMKPMLACVSNTDVVPLVISSSGLSKVFIGDQVNSYVAGHTADSAFNRFEPSRVHGTSTFSYVARTDSSSGYKTRTDPCVHWTSANPNIRINRQGVAVVGGDSTQAFSITDYGIKAALGRKMP